MMRPTKYTTGQLATTAGLSRQQIREAIDAGALCPAPGTLGQGRGKAATYSHAEVWVACIVAEMRRHGASWPTISAIAATLRPELVAGGAKRALMRICQSDGGGWQVTFGDDPTSLGRGGASWLVVDLAVVLEGLR